MFESLRRSMRPASAARAERAAPPARVDAAAQEASAPAADAPAAQAPGAGRSHAEGEVRLRVPRTFVFGDVPMPLTYH